MKWLYALLYLLAMYIGVFLIGRLWPRKYIWETRFPFKSLPFEQEGAIYNKLHILKWKTKLPDASMILGRLFPRWIPQKRIEKASKVPVLIKETCVAEATHVAATILGFGCVWFWPGAGGWCLAAAGVIFHLPFILMQRYNRPRLLKANQMLLLRQTERDCH